MKIKVKDAFLIGPLVFKGGSEAYEHNGNFNIAACYFCSPVLHRQPYQKEIASLCPKLDAISFLNNNFTEGPSEAIPITFLSRLYYRVLVQCKYPFAFTSRILFWSTRYDIILLLFETSARGEVGLWSTFFRFWLRLRQM